MKKGFTLVELLGVIVILSLVVILAVPQVLNLVKGSEEDLSEATKEVLYNATELYITSNTDSYKSTEGNVYCISLTTLNNHNLIKTPLLDSVTGDEIPLSKQVEVKVLNNSYVYELKDSCTPIIDVEPNEPELFSNMIPIVYNETISKWVYADTNDEWYDYSNKKWANAVVLKLNPSKQYKVGDSISIDDMAQMYVWIPRYKYTIFNGNNGSVDEQLINVTFEEGTATTGTVKCYDAVSGSGTSSEVCTDSTNGSIVNGTSTYTHPAFCFGRKNTNGSCNGTELTGIWIGKFEVSGSATAANLTVLPNKSPLVSQTVSSFFTVMSGVANSFNIKVNDTTYADSHMMKNMDWGAVAYLKQSEYGLGTTDIALNNYMMGSSASDYTFSTGCGSAIGTITVCSLYNTENAMAASTTGNIYGVYDMSGGTNEYVMGNMVDSSGNFYPSGAGTFSPAEKYYDAYTYYGGGGSTQHGRGKLGDATKETLKTFGNVTGGWYSDLSNFSSTTGSWFRRGGYADDKSYAGIFGFYGIDGNANRSRSSRLVITQP